MKRIMIVTTTRADWGILSPLARALTLRNDVELTVAAGNMHLIERYGHTIDDIADDCFDRLILLETPTTDTTPVGMTDITAATATSTIRAIAEHRPHALILLGDRFEILGAAQAAVFARVPIIHLHGGEVTEGAIDDTVRRAISSMASLHLVATAKAAKRLAKMGINPKNIIHTGALGVENALKTPKMSVKELSDSLQDFEIDPQRTIMVTYHPVTRDPNGHGPDEQVDTLLAALDLCPENNFLVTFPNNDDGGDLILNKLKDYAHRNPNRVKMVASLGMRRYISALHNCLAVMGNTSSGILEAPSTPAWTIDIGPRQNGRERAASVIHVEADTQAIADAVADIQHRPRRIPNPLDNPYYRPNALTTCTDAIMDFLKS